MNERINFISKNFNGFENERREKDKILKNVLKTSEISLKIDKLESLVDWQEQYSQDKSLLLHRIAEASAGNPDDLVLKTNETLDISVTENEIDGSHWIGRKKEGQAKTNY